MVIKTTNTNKTIVKQLTELMNQAFDSTVAQTIEQHNSMIELKKHSFIDNSFEKRGQGFETLFEFINDWGINSYCEYVNRYTLAMSEHNRALIRFFLTSIPLDYCLDEKTVLEHEEQNPDCFTLDEAVRLSKPSRIENHPLHNDFKANSLLDDYTTFKGTAEQAVLSIIKPSLINGLIEDFLKDLDPITELVEVINNYQDNNYHLNRFVKSLEKGIMDNHTDPLELKYVWRLWDEEFLKKTVVPLLKKRELTEEQLKSVYHEFDSNKDELLGVKNYYDYCLVYTYTFDYYFPELKNTVSV